MREYAVSIGPYVSHEHVGASLRVYGSNCCLHFDFLESDCIRIRTQASAEYQNLIRSLPASLETIAIKETELQVVVHAGSVVLRVFKSDLSFVLERSDGQVIHTSNWKRLNDNWWLFREFSESVDHYGLGEKTGRLRKNGKTYSMWNTDVLNPTATGEFTTHLDDTDPRKDQTSTEFDPYYISIPILYSLNSQGLSCASYLNTLTRSDWDLTRERSIEIHLANDNWDEFLFLHGDIQVIQRQYSQLVGTMAKPALWSLGHHISRWHPYRDSEIIGLADLARNHEIPIDSLWLDIDHMDGYRVFSWNSDFFPDPEALAQQLEDKDIRLVTIVDPGIKEDPSYSIYNEAREARYLCQTPGGNDFVGQVWPGRTVFPDFTLAEVRTWWGKLNAAHRARGVRGMWNDMNEPATGAVPSAEMTFGRGTMAHNKGHNLYAFHMAQATYEGLADAYPEERPFVLSRAGSPGISQFAANWMGDNMSRWDHLWLTIPMGCGLGLSGQPFNGADIGGFAGDSEPELLLRWYQLGMLSAFARNHTHAGSVEQFPWSFDGQFLAEIRQAINLRYQLLPYLYSCFLLAHETGQPIQTPLVYYYPNDLTCRSLDTQFMLGEQILVAPILNPGESSTEVYIPSDEWVDFYSRQPLEPGWHTHQARLDRIPLFVRGNFVLLKTAPTSTVSAQQTPLSWIEFSDFTSHLAFDDFTPGAQTHSLTLNDYEAIRREVQSHTSWKWSRDIAPVQ